MHWKQRPKQPSSSELRQQGARRGRGALARKREANRDARHERLRERAVPLLEQALLTQGPND
eukprot:5975141-Pleurochrysis_carterae.AAC.1